MSSGRMEGGERRPLLLAAAGRNRQALVTLALLALLMGTVLLLSLAAAGGGRRYDLASAGPDGLLGLRLWLEDLGYAVGTTDGDRFSLPAADLLFVYPNQHSYTPAEAAALVRWVEAGRTLVVVGPDPGDAALGEALGVRPRGGLGLDPAALLRPQGPLLPDGPETFGTLGLERPLDLSGAPQALPVIGTDGGQVTAAVRRLGAGTVWHLSPHHDLDNRALKEDRAQAALVPALLRTVPAGGRVAFDTYHLVGPAQARVGTIHDWLYGTPTGWATLFCVLVTLIYLFLQGWRLGRPLPVLAESRRREAAEYVTAMAGLQRRARLGRAVADYHKRRLKIGLGRRFGLRADLDDGDFLRALAEASGGPEAATVERVHALFAGLSGRPDEAALVRRVAEIDEVLEG